MKMIKKVEFTEQEKEALNTVVDIWRNFFDECRQDETCDGCIFESICQWRISLNLRDCVHVFKENMEERF